VGIWIYSDADNTLWDTDALYAQAQLSLLSEAEKLAGRLASCSDRLDFVRNFDQAIAALHHAGLKYPPALLLRALKDGIHGLEPSKAARRVLSEGATPADAESFSLEKYSTALSGMPPLLAGVKEGLHLAARAKVPVHVVTEGSLQLAKQRLQALGISELVASVLSATKSAELYTRLAQRALPSRSIMIGDQPDRDVHAARVGGMEAVLVPSRFRPAWTRAIGSEATNRQTDNFQDAVRLALELSQGE
jgi:putative hydrolase of the HAD superfamily